MSAKIIARETEMPLRRMMFGSIRHCSHYFRLPIDHIIEIINSGMMFSNEKHKDIQLTLYVMNTRTRRYNKFKRNKKRCLRSVPSQEILDKQFTEENKYAYINKEPPAWS
ncbi:MAG: hypothetical protein GY804_06610 [Alphaproteobacteria bacterium]|nr:hypothetical protein [Alphaproteobacteria bacterium]